MESRISDLLRILREGTAIYRDLVEHAQKKTALLVRGCVEDLLESNKVEETFNIKLRILENEMRRLCREMAQALKIPCEEFTLLKLAEGSEESVADEIRFQTGLFKNLVNQLRAVNQRNIRLIESSTRYSRGLLDFVSNATSSYESSGAFRPLPVAPTTISSQA